MLQRGRSFSKIERYSKAGTVKPLEIIARISEVFKVEKETSEDGIEICFDTFDGRLYKSGLCLTKKDDSYTLSESPYLKPLTSITVRPKRNFSFWQDFPAGEFQNKLKKLIGIRALIPLVTLDFKDQVFGIFNKDEKTVARLTFREVKPVSSGKATGFVYLSSVRGYDKEYKGVKDVLLKTGVRSDDKDALPDPLLAPGVSYTGKLNVKLSPNMTTQRAVVKILRDLINTIRQNEEGIIKDVDTEFLHDLRVAVRRTRSLFSQVKSVFSQEITDRAKREFSTLGKKTNKLRDLDVYLLKKKDYINMLPSDLRPGIEPVFRRIETERKEEQKKLARYLNSPSYKKIIVFWDNFLEDQDLEGFMSHNSAVPAADTAKRSILKRYKKITEHGGTINDQTPDPDIHSLRIECKKLRYLLEFFSSLFAKKEITLMIDHLKKLQDNLGDFNDLYVQQESLRQFLGKVEGKNSSNLETMAIGGLIVVLYKKQQEVRAQFSERFKEFVRTENTKLYDKLFFRGT